MKRRIVFGCLSALLALGSNASASVVTDGGFELPDLPTQSHEYNPSGAAWNFMSHAGIIDSDPAWPVPTAVDGSQVAFIQSSLDVVGSFSQTITLPAPSSYQLRFWVAGRSGPSGEGGDLPFEVLLDGTPIGSGASATGQPFTKNVINFSAPAGTAELLFQGHAPVPDLNIFHDNTAFFDAVSIDAIPEPCTLVLTALCLLNLAFLRRRKST